METAVDQFNHLLEFACVLFLVHPLHDFPQVLHTVELLVGVGSPFGMSWKVFAYGLGLKFHTLSSTNVIIIETPNRGINPQLLL